jgi:hypothetical protein
MPGFETGQMPAKVPKVTAAPEGAINSSTKRLDVTQVGDADVAAKQFRRTENLLAEWVNHLEEKGPFVQ